MTGRSPMDPPEIPGFEPRHLIGSGGYADVFLYAQRMPRRDVAVKVLIDEASDREARERFTDEANTMAVLSAHPYIVTIFHADVAEDGRPYLVMEYYPGPNFSQRSRNEHLQVAEVLRVAIQLCSAVETAHRSGVIHRDIKPANILTSEYGRPGLTDFGIATAGPAATVSGMSVPWSPPEIVVGHGNGDERSDVYSLAATVHTLLTGRSPFEASGGSNRAIDLIDRIERNPVPPTGRPEVSESFERLLRQGMAKRPDERPASAADFGRALQEMEVELGVAVTALEIRGEDHAGPARMRAEPGDDDGTRLKTPTVIHPQRSALAPPPTGRDVSEGTVRRDAAASSGLVAGIGSAVAGPGSSTDPPVRFAPPGEAADAGPRGAGEAPGASTGAPAGRRSPVVLAAAVVVGLVVALGAARLVTGFGSEGDPIGTTSTTSGAAVATDPILPAPSVPADMAVVSEASGGRRLTWTPPAGSGSIDVVVRDPDSKEQITSGSAAEGSVDLPADAPACVEVEAQRDTVVSAEAEQAGDCGG